MKIANAVLAGVAVVAVASNAAIAAGANALDRPKPSSSHEITITLPGGGVEHIRYTGNVAPEVVVADGPNMSISGHWSPFEPDPVFAKFDRIFANMDRYWASFDKQTSDLIAADQNLMGPMVDPNKPLLASFGTMSAGSYYVSQFSINGACTQTVRVTQGPGEARPQVVSQTSGDCGKFQGRTTAPEKATGPTPINTHGVEPAGSDKQPI